MSRIRDVWLHNLDAEMQHIRDVVEQYPYIAMDTEFPGVVARPIGTFRTSSDYHYQTMRCNVDLLRIIQIGITLSDEEGHYPEDICTWQFNFQFSTEEDLASPDSVKLLAESGIDFQQHEQAGIPPSQFAELLITSGLVLCEDVKWISFHSGYDFGYLVKLLTNVSLPASEDDFFEVLACWFPTVYDVKYMMRACKPLRGGLQDVADDLGVMRIGPSHQAGSDSLLTAATFFKMREIYFEDRIDDVEYNHKLYGLGSTVPAAVTTLANGQLALAEPGASTGLGLGLRSGATLAERTLERPTALDGASAQVAAQLQSMMPKAGVPTPGANTAGYTTGNMYQMAPSVYGSLATANLYRPINVGGGER